LAGEAVAFEDVAAQCVGDVAGESAVFGLKGAKECSYGCSAARVFTGGAQPVGSVACSYSGPAGAKESDYNAVHQSNTYYSSNSTP